MLVRDNGSTMGTMCGGCLKADVVQAARMTMKDGAPMTLPFELTEHEGVARVRWHGLRLYRTGLAPT
jgi:xanthine dehydrogenase accessory factor